MCLLNGHGPAGSHEMVSLQGMVTVELQRDIKIGREKKHNLMLNSEGNLWRKNLYWPWRDLGRILIITWLDSQQWSTEYLQGSIILESKSMEMGWELSPVRCIMNGVYTVGNLWAANTAFLWDTFVRELEQRNSLVAMKHCRLPAFIFRSAIIGYTLGQGVTLVSFQIPAKRDSHSEWQ